MSSSNPATRVKEMPAVPLHLSMQVLAELRKRTSVGMDLVSLVGLRFSNLSDLVPLSDCRFQMTETRKPADRDATPQMRLSLCADTIALSLFGRGWRRLLTKS